MQKILSAQTPQDVNLGVDKPGTYLSFNWYVGYNVSTDIAHAFRFMKGGSRKDFESYCKEKNLKLVVGPYKTRKSACKDIPFQE